LNLMPIRQLVQKTRQIDPKKLGVDSFTYVDISSVDKDTKRITEPQTIFVDDAPSRARKEIRANDVLVAIVPPQYDNQIASTGFCVLRSDTERLDPNYLFYFAQTKTFISHLTDLSTGAGYPAVSDDDILDTRIPLPPWRSKSGLPPCWRAPTACVSCAAPPTPSPIPCSSPCFWSCLGILWQIVKSGMSKSWKVLPVWFHLGQRHWAGQMSINQLVLDLLEAKMF